MVLNATSTAEIRHELERYQFCAMKFVPWQQMPLIMAYPEIAKEAVLRTCRGYQ
jgi:hypothetical protein